MPTTTRPTVEYRELDTVHSSFTDSVSDQREAETIDTSLGGYYEGIAMVAIGIVILGIVAIMLLKQHFNPTRTH